MNQRPDFRFNLYLSSRPVLVDYASRMLGSRDAAEDIVQEAFIRFVPSSTVDSAPPPPKAYLFRIVHNLAIDLLRRRKREARQIELEVPDWAGPQPVPTPEEDILFCEGMRRAMDMISNLPEKQRVALEMVRFGGYSVEQVSTHLGVSVRTTYRLIEEAMITITTLLRENQGNPASRDPARNPVTK